MVLPTLQENIDYCCGHDFNGVNATISSEEPHLQELTDTGDGDAEAAVVPPIALHPSTSQRSSSSYGGGGAILRIRPYKKRATVTFGGTDKDDTDKSDNISETEGDYSSTYLTGVLQQHPFSTIRRISATEAGETEYSSNYLTDVLEHHPLVMRRIRRASRRQSTIGACLDETFYQRMSMRLHQQKRRGGETGNAAEHHQAALEEFFHAVNISHTGDTLESDDLFFFFLETAERMKITIDENVLHMAVDAFIDEVGGEDDKHCITKSQFFQIFQDHEDVLRSAFQSEHIIKERALKRRSQRSQRRLSKQEVDEERQAEAEIWTKTRKHWKSKGRFLVWLFLYGAASVALFIHVAIVYARREPVMDIYGNCVIVARSTAQVINLTGALLILPVSRWTMTWVQSTPLQYVLYPIDAAEEVHIVLGWAFAVLSVIHTFAHICNYTRLANADPTLIVAMMGKVTTLSSTTSAAARWGYLLKLRPTTTGVVMLLCMSVTVWALKYRRTNFNRFWYIHHLNLLMMVLMCVHGTSNLLEHYKTVYWLSIPLAMYFGPRLYRELACCYHYAPIVSAKVHGNIVLDIRLEKPPGWSMVQSAGMYALVNIPAVSRWEWHPFTLSSSPHQDHIGFHIKVAGDWTESVIQLMADKIEKQEHLADRRASTYKLVNQDELPLVRVQGPLGASSQAYRQFEVVVLIGAGIGITPMISVVRSLLHDAGKMRRTFFYWTVRENAAFAWFSSLMEEIYEQDKKRVLNIRHFLTSTVKQEEDEDDDRNFAHVLFHYAANAVHANTQMDLLLGHRSHEQIQIGRPKWDQELQHIIKVTRKLRGVGGNNESREMTNDRRRGGVGSMIHRRSTTTSIASNDITHAPMEQPIRNKSTSSSSSISFPKCGIFLCGPSAMAEEVHKTAKQLNEQNPDINLIFSKETF